MKKILVPIDFSETSLNAAYSACKIAQKNQSVLIFVHAYRVPIESFKIKRIVLNDKVFEQELDARKYFKNFVLDNLKLKGKIPIMKFDIEHGFAIDVILNKTKHYQVEMVVMGTKGASKLLDRMWGSVTSNVIKSAKVPVLAIPNNAEYRDFKKIVYATDFDAKDEIVLKKIEAFRDMFNANVSVLHVGQNDNEKEIHRKKGMLDSLGESNIVHSLLLYEVDQESVVEGIESFIENNDLDLLVMLTHDNYWFHKSVTKRIALKTEIPILVYH